MITTDQLQGLLAYEPTTGVFRWRNRRGSQRAGAVAGGPAAKGYWKITIDRQTHLAHRLAWLHEVGDWPDDEIDHINRVRTDNRIANLRNATSSENKQNVTKSNRRNASGFRGVYFANGAWVGQIKSNGVKVHLGRFSTPEAAHAAYVAARERLHPFAPSQS